MGSRCSCSTSSAAVLEIIAKSCSNWVILGEPVCSHYVTLCSNYLIGARHRGRLLKISETRCPATLWMPNPLAGRATIAPETGLT
jgi:hypothetical protein